MTRRKRRPQRTQASVIYLPPTPPGERRVATIAEACAYARVSRITLWRLVQKRKVKAYRFSRRTLVDMDSVDAWKASLPETSNANG